jgi:hypothetical protein
MVDLLFHRRERIGKTLNEMLSQTAGLMIRVASHRDEVLCTARINRGQSTDRWSARSR